MLEANKELGALDVANTGLLEEVAQMPGTGAGEPGFVLRAGIERVRGVPERAERPTTSRVVPDASRDDATRPRDAPHLAEAGERIGHEVDHQLGEGSIESGVIERQVLGRCQPNIDAGLPEPGRGNERFGWIDGRDVLGSDAADQLSGQGTRSAAHVQHALSGRDAGQVRHLRRQQRGVAAHEPVVRLGCDIEGHRTIVGMSDRGRLSTPDGPGLLGFRIAPIASMGADWKTLDSIWARAGALDVFTAGWMSDHLTDASMDRGGGALESLTTAASLAHRVPGKWIGIAVLANTFRHPALVAKSASVIDNATGGRFILGLGAGWHEGEHATFGIDLPPMSARFARYESAVATLAALFSEAARNPPGVTREDPFYPLRDATLEPPPTRERGPALWLGGQRRRGIALAARYAEGWIMPGNRAGDVAYFVDRRDALLGALEAADRDASSFRFAAQVNVPSDSDGRARARQNALEFLKAGANHITLGIVARDGVPALEAMAREVAEPVTESAGRL